MVALFSKVLESECGFTVNGCDADPQTFAYLDDAIFSGGRVSNDLMAWIADDAPDEANVHVIAIAIHRGHYYQKCKLEEAVDASPKKIKIHWWRAIELEDRKKYINTSDVLRPVAIPSDTATKNYASTLKYPPALRKAGNVGGKKIFSSDAGRQVLEQEFLKAGVHIREKCPHFDKYQRPLGRMGLDTLGFGSLIVTFRNCPNNIPLALWAGDPWYPLFPRTTNSETSLKCFLALLDEDDL
jgi:hypothetical protein